ncbi:wall-associated receptor kinase 5-like [Typha angustifolia]|uniref:wall-associated receptor kinase 5-like n=1 Tax=Typha angustifolia TaxID=59011 RepID=UPI003C2FB831
MSSIREFQIKSTFLSQNLIFFPNRSQILKGVHGERVVIDIYIISIITMLLPLLPLLICLQLLYLPWPSSSNFLDPSILKPDVPPCYNISIPYPFGIVGNFSLGLQPPMSGFSISCTGSIPVVLLSNVWYEVLDISVPDGYIRIAGQAFAWHCYNNSSGPSFSPDRYLNLDGTPYTFSDTRNKFTAVGCDAMAMIRGAAQDKHKYIGGCVSFCVTKESIIDGTCSGVGCCQASVPKGLKRLNLELTSVRKLTGSRKDESGEPCSKAFIVEEDYYVFSAEDLIGNPRDQYMPVVLEWSIGNKTCQEVGRTNACKNNSYCYDSFNGMGYRCNCSKGFKGNPYLEGLDGCQDIDECSDPKNSPCVHRCINTRGGFNCTCPLGTSGDGTTQGTGCKRTATLETALGAGLALLLLVLILSFWTYWFLKKRKHAKLKQKYFLQNGGFLLRQQIFSQKAPARIFSSDELKKATDDFNEDRILGRGGYGTVYKGVLSDQKVVAIKKSKLVDQTQIEQFINEVIILSQINHKNVVKLLGCCLETQVPLLVYEFISNGTLFHHLHNDLSAPMTWESRLRIAVETAAALAFLHSATELPIIHRDVKSANILLDESYTAKVSDFGASRLIPYDHTHVTTLVQGTLGYLDPEYFGTSQLTEKSDVYSFGVVLVELLTREKPISFCRSEEGRNLALHFTMMVEENRHLEMLDSRMVKEAGARHLNVVAQVAVRCLRLKGEERPRMKEVAIELDALRRLMKHHLAEQNQEKDTVEQSHQEEISLGGPSTTYSNDTTQRDSGEISLLSM